jgi:DNA-binding CsgD family transcriptional regulator
MMNEMMNGGMGLMMPGMLLGTTLWLLLLAVLTWVLITWLNRGWSRPQPVQYTPQPASLSQRKRAHRAGTLLADQPEIQPELPLVAVQRQGAEPLSRQELRVLRLLVSGQTYAEMAEALIVSPNTIKTQVSSIYRKLGVSRRAEAIAATQRLHLL